MSDQSAFLTLWKQARAQFDTVFAEAFSITPMIQFKNDRPITDGTRLPMTFQAGYQSPSLDDYGMSPGHANNMGQKAESSQPCLIMSEEALAYLPSPPDRIVRLSNGERFEVSTIEPDGYGRIVINLTLRKAAL